MINESQNFLLTSDNLEPFTITSFKISGNITGNGQAKIYIDSGKGQRVLVYKNIEKKEKTGLSTITGASTESDIESNKDKRTDKQDKWLVIKPIKVLLEKEVFDEIGNDEYLMNGAFSWQCIESCFVRMEISRNIAYRLVFLVEEGTILKIDEVVFQTEY